MSCGIALVTGSSRGIGRAIALRLATDGFDVAVNDLGHLDHGLRTLEKEILDKGRRCAIVVADVSSESDVKGMVERVVAELGGLDVVSACSIFWSNRSKDWYLK